MKKPLIFVLIALTLATLACSANVDLPKVEDAGPTQTVDINEPLPQDTDTAVNVYLEMGAGELNVSGGAESLAEGTIRYNIERWNPEVSSSDTELRIVQKTASNLSVSNDIINEWDIRLNNETLMDMEIHAGAYQGEIELGGLRLRNLEIADGASESTVSFNEPNPEVMERFRYTTGASKVELTGLSNANFDVMTFDSGAGDYRLDFSGELLRDATVRIHSGVSQVTIVVPDGMRAIVTTSGGLNNVDLDGTWDAEGDTYSMDGEGPTLRVEVDMGVGNLVLVHD